MATWVVGLLILFVGWSFLGDNLTGEVIWTPSEVSGCSDSEILAVWDSVFFENNSDVVILKESGGDCTDYVAYKTNGGGEVWAISNYLVDYSGQIEKFIDVFYLNGTQVLVDGVNSHDTFIESSTILYFDSLLSNFDSEIDDRILSSGSVAGIFDIGSPSFSDSGSYFEFSEVDLLVNGNESLEVRAYKGETIDYIRYYSIDDGAFVAPIVVLGEIPDFEFGMNTDWNNAFDILSYFSSPYSLSYSFSFTGNNNSGGEWVDYDIDGDNVLFMPAENFTGTRDFGIRVESLFNNITSNLFSVNISDINIAPKLVKQIGFVFVPSGGVEKVDLSEYFNDNDGDDLSFRITGGVNLDVSFVGVIMSVGVKSSFNGSDEFKIYASDGENEKSSNTIYVFLDDTVSSSGGASDTSGNENASVGGGLNGSVVNDGVGSGDLVNNSESQLDDMTVNWIFWVIMIIVFLAIILVLFYFLILRRGVNESNPTNNIPVGPGGVSPVQNYIKNLNTKKVDGVKKVGSNFGVKAGVSGNKKMSGL